jgi:glycerol dehydrogenase-like iron-containing ADH family enzyme
MSHILDLLAEQAGQPLAQHGTQLAVAAIIGAEAYRRFVTEFEPAEVKPGQCYPSAEAMRARVEAAFAPVDSSGQVAADYRLKLEAWQANRPLMESFLADWPAFCGQVERFARPPERVAEILRAVGSPMSFAQLTPPADEDQVRFAFLNAPLMRKCLTLGDLLIFFNWDRAGLWQQAGRKAADLPGPA